MATNVRLRGGRIVRLTDAELRAMKLFAATNGEHGIQWTPRGVRWDTRNSLIKKGILINVHGRWQFATDVFHTVIR